MTERIHTVTATDLRIITAEILDQIRIYDQPIAVTRQGKTIAYLVPARMIESAVEDFKHVVDNAVAEELASVDPLFVEPLRRLTED